MKQVKWQTERRIPQEKRDKDSSEQAHLRRAVQGKNEQNPLWQSLAMRSGVLQPKLTVGQVDDPYEREADRVASQVAGRAPQTIAREPAAGPYATTAAGTRSGGDEVPVNSAPPRLMTAGIGGCLFGLLGGCQPAPDPNPREVNIDSFRTSGKTSDDNKCELCPRDLGVLPGVGRNGMELGGTVNGNMPGANYDFKRLRKGRTFAKIDGRWTSYVIEGLTTIQTIRTKASRR